MSFPFEEFRHQAIKAKHSEKFIELTISYARNLDGKGLPVIFSLEHFAQQVGLPIKIIEAIIKNRFTQYTRYRITKKKKDDEYRYLMSPDSKLLYIQKWINKNILQKVPLSKYCTAYSTNSSPYQNAQIHSNANQILRVDLLKFFDTITETRVQNTFKNLGYEKQLALQFAQLTTTKHNKGFWNNLSKENKPILKFILDQDLAVLPQGAPSSPQLSNIIASGLDSKFQKLCEPLKCRYSRYADDMIFSTTKKNGDLPTIDDIKKIVAEESFFINDKKTRIFKRGTKQYVTGFTVTHSAKVPKKLRKEIFMHLFFARKFGPHNHLKTWIKKQGIPSETIYNFQNWIFGKICFVFSADPEVGKKMFDLYHTIDWTLDEDFLSINIKQAVGK